MGKSEFSIDKHKKCTFEQIKKYVLVYVITQYVPL